MTLREQVAALEHQQWIRWMDYLFDKSIVNLDGSVTIPTVLVDMWRQKMATPYNDLSEDEKESDRVEADAILDLKVEYFDNSIATGPRYWTKTLRELEGE